MQANAVKTIPSAHGYIQAKRKPFFKSGEGNFFSKPNKVTPAFFNTTSVQPKLTIGKPNDIYEKEADAMADKVVQRLAKGSTDVTTKDQNSIQAKPVAPIKNITPFVQTKCASCDKEDKLQKKELELDKVTEGDLQKKPVFENGDDSLGNTSNKDSENNRYNIQRKCAPCEEKNKLQRKAIFESNERQVPKQDGVQRMCSACEHKDNLQTKAGTSSSYASTDIESSLNSSKGSGNPLPSSALTAMESSFGADFSGVRIHDDSSSVLMNNDLNAQAFTHGSDIYFNSGKYDTTSTEGKHLLAHELTHVVQQGHSITRKIVQKQDDTPAGEGTSPTPTPPAQTGIPAGMTCNPQGLSRQDFLTHNGNDKTEFGHTNITVDSSMLSPSFITFQRVGRTGRVKPVAVTVALPSIDSVYTQAGIFTEGSTRVNFDSGGDCLTDTYDLQWRITTDGANKIRDGEQEHCDDYNYAYAHSVLLYVTEVNRLAAAGTSFASERMCKRFIQRRIGFDPNDWLTRFGCLLQQSLQRDRTPHGFTHSSHEPIPVTNAPNRYNHCRYATVTITARSLPQVGQTPSSTIITGC